MSKLKEFRVEKWLRVGGIIYLVCGVLNFFVSFAVRKLQGQLENLNEIMFNYLFNNTYTIVRVICWGVFFIGFSKVVEYFKGRESIEK